jgi:hypothetical protein
MKHAKRRRWIAILSLVTVLTLGIVISLLVLGGPERDFTATAYSDVIRFQAEGVATLQVRIFDLSGKEVWNSGVVSGWTVDWDRRNDTGEQLAYGAYIYSAQGWNAQGELIFQKNGKLALMPGDKVQLQVAPSTSLLPDMSAPGFGERPLQPLETIGNLGDTGIFGQVGIGTASPSQQFQVSGFAGSSFIDSSGIRFGFSRPNANYIWATSPGGYYCFGVNGTTAGLANASLILRPNGDVEMPVGNTGIGTIASSAKLTIQGTSGNLIAAYNSSDRSLGSAVFRVESDGDVYADGTVYSLTTQTGGADVAERINTSEWVEAGYVVEIDPAHPGFFRKSSSPYSTKVAGIISTSPGVILGNSFDEATDDWEDSRPVLAIAGRVPLQVTTENGPIQIGDLLVSSSAPGVAMKGSDPEACVGAVIGKAMEPLAEETGTIVVQVMLR